MNAKRESVEERKPSKPHPDTEAEDRALREVQAAFRWERRLYAAGFFVLHDAWSKP